LHTAVSRGLHIALTCCLAAALIIAWSSQRRRNLPPKPVEVLTVASVAPLSENLQAKFVDKRQQILRILAGNLHQLTHSQVAIRHVMTDRLAVVNPHVKVKDLRKRMQKEQLRHLLVCRTDGQLVGVISDRDLKGRNGGTAASIMTKEPVATAEETPISLAVTVMLQRHISCLPVLRDGKLCGVVTTTDLLMALQCTMQLVQQIADQLHEPAEPPVAALV
jgi:acetoin utilization protein AcuB